MTEESGSDMEKTNLASEGVHWMDLLMLRSVEHTVVQLQVILLTTK